MKSTESIDATASDLPCADGGAVSPAVQSLADQRRRRLVRGVMAAAPVVLTLRSGALAAASCTGVKIASVHTKANNPRRGQIESPPVPIQAGDVCVLPGVLQACPDPAFPNKVATNSPINETNTEPVQPRSSGGVDYWTCGNPDLASFRNQNVAILSSQSVTSMGITAG